MQTRQTIKCPDFVPAWLEKPDHQEEDKDEEKWRLRFKWKKQTWTSDYAPESHITAIYEMWCKRPKEGFLKLRAPNQLYMIPWREIKNMTIIK